MSDKVEKFKVIRVGRGLYAKCPDCGALVRMNKPIIGSMHFCVEDQDPT